MLAEKSIQTAEDLLYHLPFRYEDRQNPRSLDELKPGEMASVIGEVRGAALLRTRRMPLFEAHRRPGPLCAQVHLVQRALSRRQIPCRANRRGLRQSRALALHQQLQNDPAAVRDPARRERRRRNAACSKSAASRLSTSRSAAAAWPRAGSAKSSSTCSNPCAARCPSACPQSMLARLDLPDRETALREVHFPPEGTPLPAVAELPRPPLIAA